MATRKRDGLWQNDAGVWQIDVSVGGRRVQRSAKTGSYAEASALRDKIRADLWRETQLGRGPEHTWEEAVDAYLKRARRRGNKSIVDAELHLKWLAPRLSGPLSGVTRDKIDETLAEKEREGVQRLVGGEWRRVRDVSPTTLNRYYSTISAVLNVARSMGWITVVPAWERAPEQPRVEFLEPDEWKRLRDELPAHLRILAEFSILTGLRQSTVTHLEWAHVDMARRILILPGSALKNGEPLGVPLASAALDILQRQQGAHERWVFPYTIGRRTAPVAQPAGLAWRKALVRAGLPRSLRWHSLRSTFVVWHLRAGTPLDVVMRLGGWKRLDVLLRHYAHFAPEQGRPYVDNVLSASTARGVHAGSKQTVTAVA